MFSSIRLGRSSRAIVLGGLALTVALIVVLPGGANAAKPGNSPNAKACQKGAWEDLARSEDYSGFSSEAECVSYAAQGGTLVNPLALCKQQLADAGLSEPANANYILGTPGDDDFTSQMTGGNDVICGFAGDDKFGHTQVLRAGDIFLGGDGDDIAYRVDGGTFNGGAGNDLVQGLDGGTFNGGAGSDSVGAGMNGGTFNGGDGNDWVNGQQGGTFNGDDGNDSVDGLHDGTFNGGAGNDSVLFLGRGTFNGGEGCDEVTQDGGIGGTFNQGEPCT